MRKLIWQATILVLCATAGFAWFAPAASAQGATDEVTVINGECFTTVTTSQIDITETLVTRSVRGIEYNVNEVLTFTELERTGVEVFVDELTPVPCAAPLALPDEVLGLAITGSNVNMPVAVGASLIGVGGLLVAAARKRRNEHS